MLVFLKKKQPALADVAQWIEQGLRTKGSLVGFPVKTHTWVAGRAPTRGPHERKPHIDVSLPLFFPLFPSLYKLKKKKKRKERKQRKSFL